MADVSQWNSSLVVLVGWSVFVLWASLGSRPGAAVLITTHLPISSFSGIPKYSVNGVPSEDLWCPIPLPRITKDVHLRVFTGHRKAKENQNIHCMMKSVLARSVWNQTPVSAHEFNDDWLAIVYLLSGVVRMHHVLFQCVCKCVSTVTFTGDMKHLLWKVLIKYNRLFPMTCQPSVAITYLFNRCFFFCNIIWSIADISKAEGEMRRGIKTLSKKKSGSVLNFK